MDKVPVSKQIYNKIEDIKSLARNIINIRFSCWNTTASTLIVKIARKAHNAFFKTVWNTTYKTFRVKVKKSQCF